VKGWTGQIVIVRCQGGGGGGGRGANENISHGEV
jgi:hypothetical protein